MFVISAALLSGFRALDIEINMLVKTNGMEDFEGEKLMAGYGIFRTDFH